MGIPFRSISNDLNDFKIYRGDERPIPKEFRTSGVDEQLISKEVI